MMALRITLPTAFVAGTLALSPALAGHDRGGGGSGHPGSAYGQAGGISPDLALANVYSGIYGVPYTFDRRHYDFNRCPPPSSAGSQRYIDPACRGGWGPALAPTW